MSDEQKKTEVETKPEPRSELASSVRQSIYKHGGSRLWIEQNGERELIVDTYTTAEFAKAIRAFTEEWLRQNAAGERRGASVDRGGEK